MDCQSLKPALILLTERSVCLVLASCKHILCFGDYQSIAYIRIRRRDCADRMDRNRWPKVAGIMTVKKYGGMKIKAKLKANCEGEWRSAQIQGTWLFGGLNFATWRQIFSAQFLKFFSLTNKTVLSVCEPSTSVS